MGVVLEILPARRSASLSETMVYFILAPTFTFFISTVERICTMSVRSFDVSRILAAAIVALSSFILFSRIACAYLSASYSAF